MVSDSERGGGGGVFGGEGGRMLLLSPPAGSAQLSVAQLGGAEAGVQVQVEGGARG